MMTHQFGKSLLSKLSRDYVEVRGGQLVSDTTKNGLRTEVFAMPNKERWAFVSPSPTGGSNE